MKHRNFWLCLMLMMPLVAWNQKTGQDEARQKIRDYIKARAAWEEPGLTTSLADCRTGLPFLDDYTPARFMPLAEMPRAKERGFFLVASGGYEMDAAAFCLQERTYRPARGEGYLFAPLAGRAAGPIREVLWNWTDHPEFSRRQVQLVLWALANRVDVRRLPANVQPVARALLGDSGLKMASIQARGPEPKLPELADPKLQPELEKAAADVGKVDPAAQKEVDAATKALEALTARQEKGEQVDPENLLAAMERLVKAQEKLLKPTAEAVSRLEAAFKQMEDLLTAATATYEEIERQAVLEGNPSPPPGSRNVPAGRWSFHPGGYFVRYFPEDYTRVRLELSLPPEFTFQRDARGRLIGLSDAAGSRLIIGYDDAVAPLVVDGDEGLSGHALRGYSLGKLQYTAAGTKSPQDVGAGWTFVGTPVGGGRARDAAPRLTGVAARYQEATGRRDEISGLIANLSTSDSNSRDPGNKALEPPDAAADILDLAHLTAAVRSAEKSGAGAAALRLVQEAWQASVCARVADLPGAKPRRMLLAGRAAAASEIGLMLDGENVLADPENGQAKMSGLSAPAGGPRSAGAFVPPGLLAVPRGSDLPVFDPRDGAINPCNTARQRLGIGPVQNENSDFKKAMEAAIKGCEFIQGALDVFNGLTDPITFVLEKMGLGAGGLPGMMLGEIIQCIFDMAAEISRALGGDPPRFDFQVFTPPPAPELPALTPGRGMSAARAQAGNAAAQALLEMYRALRAAQITGDRLGGALRAGDEAWIWRQATAYVYFKRQAGQRMLEAADRYEALLRILEREGAKDRAVTTEELNAHQQELRRKGLRTASLEAARKLGLSDEEIEAAGRRRLSLDPEKFPEDGILAGSKKMAEGLRALGQVWIRLPAVPSPQ